jgi:hypothetical protein
MNVEDKDKRVSFAYELNEALVYVFLLLQAEIKLGNEINPEEYYSIIDTRIRDVYEKAGITPNEEYISLVTTEIIDTTLRHTDDPYYVSRDRALLIAQNEANTAYNLKNHDDAVASGKKYKTWITEQDMKVRAAHESVDMQKIPIDDYFTVGNDRMRFPHDYINGSPENLINCRCICTYE